MPTFEVEYTKRETVRVKIIAANYRQAKKIFQSEYSDKEPDYLYECCDINKISDDPKEYVEQGDHKIRLNDFREQRG